MHLVESDKPDKPESEPISGQMFAKPESSSVDEPLSNEQVVEAYGSGPATQKQEQILNELYAEAVRVAKQEQEPEIKILR